MKINSLAILAGLTFCSFGAFSQIIVPTSYTATPGDLVFIDNTGSQLTDSVLGVNDYAADLGNGVAYEWVGWANKGVTIEFSFDTEVTIETVRFGTARKDADLIVPLLGVTIVGSTSGGGNVSFIGDTSIADGTRGWREVTGPFVGSTLTINAGTGSGNWLVIDEIQLLGPAVPEPATYATIAGLGLFGFSLWRRARRGHSLQA